MRSEGFYVNEKSTDTSWDRTSHLPICTCRERDWMGTAVSIQSRSRQVAVTVSIIPDTVYTVIWAPDDGWWYHPKHVERFTDINKMYIAASCWIIIDTYYTLHGPLNIKYFSDSKKKHTESALHYSVLFRNEICLIWEPSKRHKWIMQPNSGYGTC